MAVDRKVSWMPQIRLGKLGQESNFHPLLIRTPIFGVICWKMQDFSVFVRCGTGGGTVLGHKGPRYLESRSKNERTGSVTIFAPWLAASWTNRVARCKFSALFAPTASCTRANRNSARKHKLIQRDDHEAVECDFTFQTITPTTGVKCVCSGLKSITDTFSKCSANAKRNTKCKSLRLR